MRVCAFVYNKFSSVVNDLNSLNYHTALQMRKCRIQKAYGVVLKCNERLRFCRDDETAPLVGVRNKIVYFLLVSFTIATVSCEPYLLFQLIFY